MVNHAPLPPPVLARVNAALAVEIDIGAAAAVLTPFFRNGRRPKFWSDDEVLRALTLLCRQVTIEQAQTVVRQLYGPARTPGTSSIQRYWAVLDAANAARAVLLPTRERK